MLLYGLITCVHMHGEALDWHSSSASFIEVGLSITPRIPWRANYLLLSLPYTAGMTGGSSRPPHLWRFLEILTLVLMLEWQVLRPVNHLSSSKFFLFSRHGLFSLQAQQAKLWSNNVCYGVIFL